MRSQKPYLLRDPSCSAARIAFSYGGNIWVVNHDGEELHRVTSGGNESKPAFSPDGTQIAFIGEYGPSRSVYVVPAEGGEPRRLTHHPADLSAAPLFNGDMVGWTPDGTRVLFSSHRAAFAGGVLPIVQLYTVPVRGGFATPLPLARAAQGCLSPDGKRIAYIPHIRYQRECKRYRGGQTPYIWIANLTDSRVESKIPHDRSSDFNPMWIGENIYFLSDRDGSVTLFSYHVKSGEVRRLLKNEGLDIKSASAAKDAIVYEQFGSLHLLDLRSGRHRSLDIQPSADFPEVLPRVQSVSEMLLADEPSEKIIPKISPSGIRAVLGVRGRIITVSAESDDVRVLNRSKVGVQRDPAWSPDGKSIAYFCDESGEYALHVSDQSCVGIPRKIDLGAPSTFYYSPTWSPDSQKIGYTDKHLNYWYVDLEEKRPIRIDADLFTDPGSGRHDLQLAWSPDSRWIAYTKQLPTHLHAIFVYSIESGESHQITDGMSDARYVAFDKGGQYLYFTGSTDVGMTLGWIDMSSFQHPVTRSVYALVLRKGIRSPVPELKTDEGRQETPDQIESAVPANGGTSVEIDFENIARRIVRLPIPARNYCDLLTSTPGTIFLVEGPEIYEFLAFRGYPPQRVYRLDLNTRRAIKILDDVIHFALSFNGEKVLYGTQNEGRKRWFITGLTSSSSTSCEQTANPLKLDGVKFTVEPRVEWRHLYEQIWRNQREFFYDPNLHGLNLEQVMSRYEPFLENIVTREELDYLFDEMLGNMTVLHMGALRPQAQKPRCNTTGLLGADYSVENGRYRFARIYDSDPWSEGSRSPLRDPGMNVEVGEYLLQVNGNEVSASTDLFSYFGETAGKHVVLKVGPRPDLSDSRDLTVVPLDNEYALRYFAWIEGNRLTVDKLSGDRLAYVHVPDAMLAGYKAFQRYFFAQSGKEAVIIDVRYNNGGCPPDYIIDCLRRTPWCHWHMREGRDITTPMLGIFGPKATLINETSSSAGDWFPWAFRQAKLGPLIGTRTWGGLVGHYTFPHDLLDGSIVATPNCAFYSPQGEWEVENRGVEPDIEVADDPKAARAGRDVQLERAVEVLMELLKKGPTPSAARHPPFPNYHCER